MSRPSFKVYHRPDCAETAQFLDILGQFNLEYETILVGTDISESQYEILFGPEGSLEPRVLCCNNQQDDKLRYDARGDEWMNMGNVEAVKKLLLHHNEIESFN